MDLRQRISELRAEPQPTGKPIGLYPLIDRLKAEGYTFKHNEIRRILGIGAFGDKPEEAPVSIQPPPLSAVPKRGWYDTAADAFLQLIEQSGNRFGAYDGPRGSERYALISDVHCPFHDPEALLQVVREAREAGCTGLIIGGDGFDFYALSRYVKTKDIEFEDELAKCRAFVEFLASQFEHVYILPGNHDQGRWERVMAEEITKKIRFLVRSPWDVILTGLSNVEKVGHNAPFGESVGWLWQLGEDAIITHCEASSAQQGVNLEKLKHWVREWAPVLGFTKNPRLICTGHTHRKTEHDEYDLKLIETGNLASWSAQAYQFQAPGGAQLKNRKPGVQSWAVIVQENGRTNLKETRTIRLRA